jgi:hypothetical protein
MSTSYDLEEEVKQQAKHLSSLTRVMSQHLVTIQTELVELGDKLESGIGKLHREISELRSDLNRFKDEVRTDLKEILARLPR